MRKVYYIATDYYSLYECGHHHKHEDDAKKCAAERSRKYPEYPAWQVVKVTQSS